MEYFSFLGHYVRGTVKGNKFIGEDKMTYPMNVPGAELISKKQYDDKQQELKTLAKNHRHSQKKKK